MAVTLSSPTSVCDPWGHAKGTGMSSLKSQKCQWAGMEISGNVFLCAQQPIHIVPTYRQIPFFFHFFWHFIAVSPKIELMLHKPVWWRRVKPQWAVSCSWRAQERFSVWEDTVELCKVVLQKLMFLYVVSCSGWGLTSFCYIKLSWFSVDSDFLDKTTSWCNEFLKMFPWHQESVSWKWGVLSLTCERDGEVPPESGAVSVSQGWPLRGSPGACQEVDKAARWWRGGWEQGAGCCTHPAPSRGTYLQSEGVEQREVNEVVICSS